MLKILHGGVNVSLPLDTTGFTGDLATDSALTVVTEKKAGRAASIHDDGTVHLMNGGASSGGAGATLFAGVIVNDAAGYFYENKPAMASGLIPVMVGYGVIITDQVDVAYSGDGTTSIHYGDPVYVGTGGNVGLFTAECISGKQRVGIALSEVAHDATAPQLKLLLGV